MLQETVERLRGLPGAEPPTVASNNEHRFLVAEQLRAIGAPPRAADSRADGTQHRTGGRGRCTRAREAGSGRRDARPAGGSPDPRRGDVPPRDPQGGCRRAGRISRRPSASGPITRRPATATSRAASRSPAHDSVFHVARFVEKPDAATARKFLEGGTFAWNSGMFVLGARRYLEELDRHAPDDARRMPRGMGEGRDRPRLRPARSSRVRSVPRGLDRLRRDGKDRCGGDRSGGHRLERRRLVGDAMGGRREG